MSYLLHLSNIFLDRGQWRLAHTLVHQMSNLSQEQTAQIREFGYTPAYKASRAVSGLEPLSEKDFTCQAAYHRPRKHLASDVKLVSKVNDDKVGSRTLD